MFAQMFQRLSCGFYALHACYVWSDVSEALLRVLRTLSVSRLFKVCSGVSEALAFVFCCASLLGIYCQAALYRWEGMAASTNCSSNVNCCAIYIADIPCPSRTEINNDWGEKLKNRPRRHLADAHAPAYGITHIRACAMERSRKLFRLFSRHISGTQLFRENRHVKPQQSALLDVGDS